LAARSVQSRPLTCVTCALVVIVATLSSPAAVAQAEAEPEVAPAEPVEVFPAAPPATAPASPPPDEAEPLTPARAAPTPSPVMEKASPVEAAPAPVPATPDKPPAPPSASPAPTSPPRKGRSAGRRETPHSATTLTIVNGRAVPATAVAVLVGAKVVTRSGPLAPNARVTLKLPRVKACRVSVVASFPGWYSSLRSGQVNICKARQAVVRL
jgi:hypothetical protein